MAFRKWIVVLFALALFAGLASAQQNATLQCTAVSVPPQIRAESYTDLMGDIIITCTGGPQLAPGQQIPQANIAVQVSVPVTSRVSSDKAYPGLSEALLTIDEPGSGLTAIVPGFGPAAPQLLCPTPASGCTGGAAISSGGIPYMPTTSGAASPTNVPNVYQGYVTGTNLITFFGVPVLPPASNGVSRVLRITNVRVNATGFLGASAGISTISAFVSTNSTTSLPLVGSPLVTTGFVLNSLTASAALSKANGTLLQCNAPGGSPGAVVSTLSFKEQFGTAFKTRVVPMSATPLSGTGTNISNAGVSSQNVPGGQYTGFGFSASESGFIFPNAIGGLTAGLADFGTRFKAVFTNIPSGISLYVSTTNVDSNGNPLALPITTAGNAVSPITAVLVASATAPEITTQPTSTTTQLVPVNGTATAVWEVVNDNPNALDTFTFNVYVNYAPNTANGLPTAPSTGNVTLGYAPTPSDIGITPAVAGAAATASTAPIPRFAEATGSTPFVNIVVCQTALLWPYVVVGGGFETGLGIANTTSDPFTTAQGHVAAQAGSCNLSWFGQQYTASGSTVATVTPTTFGCDQASAVAGACVGIGTAKVIPSGQVYAATASSLQTVAAGNTWIGYVIGLCNFQYAHGYAAISDIGARNWVTSYLALVLQTNTQTVNLTLSTGGTATGSITNSALQRGPVAESLNQ